MGIYKFTFILKRLLSIILILSLVIGSFLPELMGESYLAPPSTEIDILATGNNGDISFLDGVLVELSEGIYAVPDILVEAFGKAFHGFETTGDQLEFSSEEAGKRRYDSIIALLQEKAKQDPDGEASKLYCLFLTGDKDLTNSRRKAFEEFLRSSDVINLIPRERIFAQDSDAIDCLTMAAFHRTMEGLADHIRLYLTLAKLFFKIQFPPVYETIIKHIEYNYPFIDPKKYRTFWLPFVFPYGFLFEDLQLLKRGFTVMRNSSISLIPVSPLLNELEEGNDKHRQLREYILPIKDQPGSIVTLELLYNGILNESAILDKCIHIFNGLEKRFFEIFGKELEEKGKLRLYKQRFMAVRREMDSNIELFGFRKLSQNKPYYSMPEAERYKIPNKLPIISAKSV